MKIAILGSTGMLGSMVKDYFNKVRKPDDGIWTPSREDLDVEHLTDENKRELKRANWIINCIGIIKPHIDDNDPVKVERAIRVNSLFPYELAKLGRKVIQIETDCVYSGDYWDHKEGYEHDPIDVYGKTKSLGEVRARNVYHIRTSIIGPELEGHKSMFDWFMGLPKGEKIKGYTSHYWNGVTTLAFAKLCWGMIHDNYDNLIAFQHFFVKKEVSKYDLLKVIAKIFDRTDIKIKEYWANPPINRELGTHYTKMHRYYWQLAGYKHIPTIEELLVELKKYKESK